MDSLQFPSILRSAIIGAWTEFRNLHPGESPYALALCEHVSGRLGYRLDYAVATEEGLVRIAARFDAQGYRCKPRWDGEQFRNTDRLALWLRWSHPDDGWYWGEFPLRFAVQPNLDQLIAAGAFGPDAENLEESCTEVLTSLGADSTWCAQTIGQSVILGAAYDGEPRDFLRTATRANRFALVKRLWAEKLAAEELASRITWPGAPLG